MVAQMDFPNEELDDDARAAAAKRETAAALRREHAGYVRYGRGDRAELVAAELKAIGEPLEDAAESAPRQRAAPKRAKS
jgi:hypothetical protein